MTNDEACREAFRHYALTDPEYLLAPKELVWRRAWQAALKQASDKAIYQSMADSYNKDRIEACAEVALKPRREK